MDLAVRTDKVQNELGDALRRARGERSIEALAEALEVSRNTLGDYERGVRAPEMDFLVRFAAATGADLSRLLSLRLNISSGASERNILEALTFTAKANPELWRRATKAAGLVSEPTPTPYGGEHQDNAFSEFELVERRGILGAAGPAGAENVILQKRGALAFRRAWLRYKNVTARELIVVDIDGDSMEKTLFHRDTVVFRDQTSLTGDDIYLFMLEGRLFVKRLAFRPGVGIEVISDNRDHYPPFTLTEKEAEAQQFQVKGRFLWRGGDRLQ